MPGLGIEPTTFWLWVNASTKSHWPGLVFHFLQIEGKILHQQTAVTHFILVVWNQTHISEVYL